MFKAISSSEIANEILRNAKWKGFFSLPQETKNQAELFCANSKYNYCIGSWTDGENLNLFFYPPQATPPPLQSFLLLRLALLLLWV
jgi:hypothetical protein